MADPYRNFKFEVEIDGFVRAGFSKVSGLEESTETIEYREGGENETPHKLPGQTTYEDVTFERGQSNDADFIAWRNQIFNLDQANGVQGDNETFRKTLKVYLKDKAGTRVKKWTLFRGWPNKKSSPELDASGNDVAMESLVVTHEGMKEETLV